MLKLSKNTLLIFRQFQFVLQTKTEPTIIIFSGYARSGKTTTMIPALTEMGYQVVSTSETLYIFCDKLLQTMFNLESEEVNLKNKEMVNMDFIFTQDFITRSKNYRLTRNFLIDIAEKCLVKVFGREIFSYQMLKQLREAIRTGSKVAIETIGGEEFDILYGQLTKTEKEKVLLLNVRRKNEEKGVDIRQLIKTGRDIYNNSTRESFNLKLKEVIQKFKING